MARVSLLPGSSKLPGAKPMTPEQYAQSLETKPIAKQEFKVLPPVPANRTTHEIALAIIAENPLGEFCHKEGIALKREGNDLVGLCPFHDENTPSFHVWPDHYHCFGSGCGKHGDIIDLYQHLHNCQSFTEAARHFGHDASRANEIVAIYDYLDEKGQLVKQILRYNYPKRFKVRHKLPTGEWDFHRPEKLVPYHLDEVVRAQNEIYIVEGEKDADTLRKLHLVATTNPFGGGKWPQYFDQYFHGRTIYICPDTDKGGQDHCQDVGKKLLHVAKEIHVVSIPKEFKDVTELYENDPKAFEERLKAACIAAKPFADFQANGDHPTEGDPTSCRLTIWTPSQFLAYEDDPQDILLSNGYIEKGSPVSFCGPPGIGKSRIILQLAICSILGGGFLGWETNAQNLKWLIFQNENGNRRIKGEFQAMLKDLTQVQRKMLDDSLFMTAIVSDIDGDLNLADENVRKRVIEAVGDYKPDFVVGDPLSALSIEDLNHDQAMLNTARNFGRIARFNNIKSVPMLVQHAKTGKEAQSGMSGFNRSSYARNSKALIGWVRSQFNMGPVEEKKNDRLFFASGKANNAPEFDELVIELDHETRFYSKTEENPETLRQENNQKEQTKTRKHKLHPTDLKAFMSPIVPLQQSQVRDEIVVKKQLCSVRTFKSVWKDAKELGLIKEDSTDKYLYL
jgi:RecA-family ATPase